MAKKVQGELVEVITGFDYASLGDGAEKVRSSAETIRSLVRNSLENIINVGQELLAVKDALPHGQFSKWLDVEFGWRERTARNFIAVAEQFGKTANFAELPIQPSAAYLLAAPSAPDEAREVAIEKAQAGEQITVAAAKEIMAEARKKGKEKNKPKQLPAEKLGLRLVKVLERYRERWKPAELSELGRQLREFADALEKSERGGRRKGKE